MIRSIVNDKRSPHPVSGALSGLYFEKVQNGGDWSPFTPFRTPKAVGDELIASQVKAFTAEIKTLRTKYNSSKDRRLLKVIADLKTRRSVLSADLQVYRLARLQDNAQVVASRIEQRRRRKEENHNYVMNLQSGSYGVGDVFNPYGVMIQSNVSIVDYFGFVEPPINWDDNDDISLANKLASKLQEHVDFHAAVTLAEIDKTRTMIADSAKKLARGLRKAARGDVLGAIRVMGNVKNSSAALGSIRKKATRRQKWIAQGDPVRDRYLLYQLGIKPLVSDVQAAARALAWYLDRPQYQKVRAQRKKDPKDYVVDGRTAYYASKTMVMAQYVAILKSTPPAADVLGLTDIASGLYERVPLSWVVDQWIPIGGWLESLHAKRVFGEVFTVKTVVTRTHQSIESSRQPDGMSFTANRGTNLFRVSLVRTCGIGINTNTPTFKPLFHKDGDVRTRHTLESIALAHKYAQILDNSLTRKRKAKA